MKPEDRKRLKRHIDMVMNRMDDINGIPENYRGRKGIANDVNNPAEVDWRDEYRKLKVEFDTLRFKESQEQRFIWWVWNVYSKNVNDLILSIISATTYDNETMAKMGKYGLPIKCFEILERVKEGTDHIYDGTYLDVEISTDVKRDLSDAEIEELGAQEAENRAEPSQSDSSVTQNNTNRDFNNH